MLSGRNIVKDMNENLLGYVVALKEDEKHVLDYG